MEITGSRHFAPRPNVFLRCCSNLISSPPRFPAVSGSSSLARPTQTARHIWRRASVPASQARRDAVRYHQTPEHQGRPAGMKMLLERSGARSELRTATRHVG